MSSFTRQLIKTYAPLEIIFKRRRNYKTLGSLLKNYPGITPLYDELPDQVCPLCYPLLVEDRDAMAKKLSHQSIDARGWWRGFHKMLPWPEFPEACYLKKHLLALPVHQDLTEPAIEYMARCVKQLR
jgi:dTDP-4-amino-4,6-dideoxygalactose transaminase